MMTSFKLSSRIEKTAQSPAQRTAESMFKIMQFMFYRVPEKNKAKFLSRVRGKVTKINPAEISNKPLPPTAAIGQAVGLTKNLLFGLNPSFVQEVLAELVKVLAKKPKRGLQLPPGTGV
jgi:hypothetical protein